MLATLYIPVRYKRMNHEDFLLEAKNLGFGKVEKYSLVNKDGKKGWLIWDYRLWNEISFVDFEQLKSESLFKNVSDSKTEKEFLRLARKYSMHGSK